MSRLIPAVERIQRARALIQQARDVPVPAESGRYDMHYIAQVKTYLQEARELIKLIPYTPTATPEMKEEVKKIFLEADLANKEILHGKNNGL